jgi:cell division protein FtsI (penicillin-binding protein 3)
MIRLDRLSVVSAALTAFAVAIVGRAVQVQIIEHDKWRTEAVKQQYTTSVLLARRGTILDGAEVPLAESQELVRINIATREIVPDERRILLRRLRAVRSVKLTPAQLRVLRGEAVDPWIPLGGVHYTRDLDQLRRMKGVHLEPAIRRAVAVPVSLVPVVGKVDGMGRATDGLELSLDSLLQGVSGSGVMLRDRSRGQPFSPFSSVVKPTPGNDIVLTFHRQLQELVERELVAGVRRHAAVGGDVLVMDARSGAVLAAVGVRAGKVVPSATPLTEPYEPGSVIKPFVVAALLDRGATTPTTVINTENGRWTTDGRTFEDSHKAAQMTVADIIRYSSNIGIVKLVQSALPRDDEYALMRDLGLGAPTGVPYLGESSGRLPTRNNWTKWTWAQLATGYELLATPLQLAQAYTALANQGTMIEPTLVSEIRDPDQRVIWRHTPRAVRAVMTPNTAQVVNSMLESVVDSGTATAAGLSSYAVSGKSGTARRALGKQGYVPGHYNSSFVALFPADAPQLIVVARMIDASVPNNYGGATAGTVVRGVLSGTLGLPDVLDRRALREIRRPAAIATKPQPSPDASISTAESGQLDDSIAVDTAASTPRVRPTLPAPPVERTVVVPWPAVGSTSARGTAAPTSVVVPDVHGLSLRDAVRALHAAGLRVAMTEGRSMTTIPAAGAAVRRGSVVRLAATP